MFAKIRKAVTGLMDEGGLQEGGWVAEKEYESTIGVEELKSFPEEPRVVGTFEPGKDLDYQAEIVKAAIEADGRRGEYRIPVWWLKAVLADLEGRSYESQPIWERSEMVAGVFDVDSVDQSEPGFGRMFPEDSGIRGT